MKKIDNSILLYSPKNEAVEVNFILPFKKKILLPAKKWVKITSSGIQEFKKEISLF